MMLKWSYRPGMHKNSNKAFSFTEKALRAQTAEKVAEAAVVTDQVKE